MGEVHKLVRKDVLNEDGSVITPALVLSFLSKQLDELSLPEYESFVLGLREEGAIEDLDPGLDFTAEALRLVQYLPDAFYAAIPVCITIEDDWGHDINWAPVIDASNAFLDYYLKTKSARKKIDEQELRASLRADLRSTQFDEVILTPLPPAVTESPAEMARKAAERILNTGTESRRLKRYLLSLHPPSTPEQEKEVLQSIAKGGEEADLARRDLFNSNLRLVVSISKRYQDRGIPLSKLIRAGNEGLARAVNRFEYREGRMFSSNVSWWVHQAIHRYLDEKEQ